MDMNLSINLDKISTAGTVYYEGKAGSFIPHDGDSVVVGKKGVYLSLRAVELSESKFGDTHLVRLRSSSEHYKRLKEDGKQLPIIGSARSFERGQFNKE